MDSWQRAVLLTLASLGLLALARLYGGQLWQLELSAEELAEILRLEQIPTLEREPS